MSGLTLRKKFMRQFSGMSRYPRVYAWMVLTGYVVMVAASIAFGHYLLSLPLSVWTVLLVIATSLFIGTRLRGINNIVHECSHATFSADVNDNVVIGGLCTSMLMKTFRKYREDHLSHHANNGDYETDAEFAVIEKFGLHEPLTPRTVLRHAVTPLTLRHMPAYTGVRLSMEDGWFFLALKLVFMAAMLAGLVLAPLTTIFFVLIPLFYIYPTLNFWTDCLDHAGLVGATDELKASRNVLAPAPVRLIFFPRNDSYHLVHHLFPQIPAPHLHEAHAELCQDPEYAAQDAASTPTHRALPGLLFGDSFRKPGKGLGDS